MYKYIFGILKLILSSRNGQLLLPLTSKTTIFLSFFLCIKIAILKNPKNPLYSEYLSSKFSFIFNMRYKI